jgi:hypothetical protein
MQDKFHRRGDAVKQKSPEAEATHFGALTETYARGVEGDELLSRLAIERQAIG